MRGMECEELEWEKAYIELMAAALGGLQGNIQYMPLPWYLDLDFRNLEHVICIKFMWVYADKPGGKFTVQYLEHLFLGFLGFAQSQVTLFLPADYYPGW